MVKNGQEIERRFWVRKLSDNFPKNAPVVDIIQGYFEPSASGKPVRVRIAKTKKIFGESKKAYITLKSGKGKVREEKEHEIKPGLGKDLIKKCSHQLLKDRHLIDGWEVDFYKGPLAGVIIAEKELKTADEVVNIPNWIADALEVTDSLTNYDLAKLAGELNGSGLDPIPFIENHIRSSMPVIVLTGEPCSGKSSIIELVKKEMPEIHCVPEVAAIIIGQLGIKPGDNIISNRRFQKAVYRVQRAFEEAAIQYAISQGKKAVLLDRGAPDGAAYFAGGLDEFESFLRAKRSSEYSRYHKVICLSGAPKNIFEEKKTNNPVRSESYEEACALGHRIRKAWEGHPHLIIIENGNGWTEKEASARREIEKLISGKKSA